MRWAGGLLCACVLLALSGCIDYEEDLWLTRDGSGWLVSTVRIPAELMQFGGPDMFERMKAEVDEQYGRAKGVRVVQFERVDEESGFVALRTRVAFDRVESLRTVQPPTSFANHANLASRMAAGTLEVRRDGDRSTFLRLLKTASPTPLSQQQAQFATAMLANSKLVFRVHFPDPVISTNGTLLETTPRTVEWRFTLQRALTHDLQMRAELSHGWLHRLPIPRWIYSWTTVIALATFAAGFLLARRWPRRD